MVRLPGKAILTDLLCGCWIYGCQANFERFMEMIALLRVLSTVTHSRGTKRQSAVYNRTLLRFQQTLTRLRPYWVKCRPP